MYSFGIILFEVLNGFKILHMILDHRHPPAPQIEKYSNKVARGYRPPIPEEWPDSVADLVEDCWCHQPDLRPSMTEVVERLKDILSEAPFIQKSFIDSLRSRCCSIQ